MTNWPTATGDEAPVAEFLRAIMLMDVEKARDCLAQIDPNAADFQFPVAWKLIRPDCRGSRLLHEAVTYSCNNYGNGNRLEIIEMLLDAGADPNHLSTKGYSALHNAATVNHAPACRLLVSRGAHVNQQSMTGYTPLQTASLYKGTDATAALILAGADFHLANQHGENAYDYAKRKNHSAAVSLLDMVRLREEAETILLEIGAEKARESAEHEASELELMLYVRDELSDGEGQGLTRQAHRDFWVSRFSGFEYRSSARMHHPGEFSPSPYRVRYPG